MSERFLIKELPNGITLLGQPMEHVTSAAMTLVFPAGSSYDPAPMAGAAAIATEWLMRGAGDRDSRQLIDALDTLGCQHHENIQSEHMQFSSAMLGRNLSQVARIYADIVRRPMLGDDTFEPCRLLTIQDLESMEDEPAQKCNLLLREKFYPMPLGRCPYGSIETLHAATAAGLRDHIHRHLTPKGMLLSVAGSFDWDEFCGLMDECFGDWSVGTVPKVNTIAPAGGVTHIQKDTAQMHIALAYRAVPLHDKRYYATRLAETILSGGMSGRLFTEVREKRGLVYHVSARYNSLKELAGMFVYAGTTPEKAQQTLEVTVTELRRMTQGVGEDELARAKTQLKSALVMQGESTNSRSGSLVSDWHHLGRLRSLAEISAAIDKITCADVVEGIQANPPKDFTILTIGPHPLDVKAAGV